MLRWLAAAALVPLLAVSAVGAQQPAAGPFVPLGSRLDRLVVWMIDEGALSRLDPLTRPFRLAAVRRGVAEQDTLALSSSGRRSLAWLHAELDAVTDSTVAVAELGQAFYRNGRRDSFREGGASGTGTMGGVWVSVTRGPFVAVFNPAFENRLKDDPEFTGKTDRFVAGRVQTGYIALTGERGDLVYGRYARNWGPDLFGGLQLSPSAYATDMVSGALRMGRLELTTIAQRLDDYDTTLAATVTRWFLAHRLTVRAGKSVWLAFTETGVYGGTGRGFEPAFHSPLNLGLLTEFNEHRHVNLLWGVDAYARLGGGATIAAQGVIDDIQIDKDTLSDRRPISGGFSVQLTEALASARVHLTFGYTQVRSLTYRNSFAPWEVYAVQGVGIARNFADYDHALLRLQARPLARTHIALDAGYLRQGSGDFRLPFPPDSVLARPGQDFLVAPVRRAAVVRIAVSYEPYDGLLVNGVLGQDGNAIGADRTIAALSVRMRLDLLRRRFGAAWPAVERGHDGDWP